METFTTIHASDVDGETLQGILADYIKYEQAKAFRKVLLTRLSAVAFVVWILSWPAHLLPHGALWVTLGIVALATVLTSPTAPANPGTPTRYR